MHVFIRILSYLHQKENRKREKKERKKERVGLGAVWGKTWHPFRLYSAPGEYLDVWLRNTFIEIITSFTLSTGQFNLFCDAKDILFTTIKEKKSPITPRRISWAIPYVTWTEFIYLIFSTRLIGHSAHKQMTRIRLDVCEILGQKAFLVCPCGGQGETGPPALWNTRLQR